MKLWSNSPQNQYSALTWTEYPTGGSARTGRGTVNKSHLIDVLTPLLRQRSAASRNNRSLPSQTAHVCEHSDGHMGRAACDSTEDSHPASLLRVTQG